MYNSDVVERVLETVGISNEQVDLVGRILALEKDKERVHSVKLSYDCSGGKGLSVDVFLLKQFNELSHFRDYLKDHDLPENLTFYNSLFRIYVLLDKGIETRFTQMYVNER